MPDLEVIVADEHGKELPRGETGEVLVRGYSVMQGYLDDPEATTAAIDARGFLHTGDLATRTSDGAIRIVGRRATDLIKTGGFKVGAGEVEAAILEHPAVAEVAVLGMPDDDLGERIVAFVVKRPGAEVEEDALEAVKEAVVSRMSGAAELDVPLVVDTGHGPDWDTAH